MKLFSIKSIVSIVSVASIAITATAQKPFTIPEVQNWTPVVNSSYVVKDNLKNLQTKICNDATLGSEGYRINITAGGITAEAATEQGLRYARTTLLQMLEQSKDLTLPCGTIEDKPQYKLRGFMMDCGRKFIPMKYLHDLVDIMAYYKMNMLHLHLNDNGFKVFNEEDWNKTYSAFRLECDTYPGLTAQDGSYSKDEFRELVKHGERVGVEILPEIDVPAHSLAFTKYRPELGSDEFGMDHLNLRRPDLVYPFVDALFKEYLEGPDPVFRGPRVNIGTDEYSNRDSAVVEEFRHFTDHYIRLIESYGKQAVLWGSLTHAKGKTPIKVDNVLMDCWSNGYADPVEMKKLGYQLVSIPDGWVYIVPAAGYYYDYLNCKWLYNDWTPANINGKQFEEGDPQIEGGMFAVWNDHCGNGISVDDIHHRLFPAMQTIAAKTWTGYRISFTWNQFDTLRTHLSEAPGINRLGRLCPCSPEYRIARVKPGKKQDIARIGYNYKVSFDIDYKKEQPGTVLFDNGEACFYLADPIQNKVGFSRDGYLFTFNYVLQPGRHSVSVEGTNTYTRLYVDGKMVSSLDRHWQYYNERTKMAVVPTLVFPFGEAGHFKSIVTNLVATNLK